MSHSPSARAAGYICVPVSQMPVGQEFLWGAYELDNMNVCRKRSTRTIECRYKVLGILCDTWEWTYFHKRECGWIKPTNEHN
jgi:hypothetical protein